MQAGAVYLVHHREVLRGGICQRIHTDREQLSGMARRCRGQALMAAAAVLDPPRCPRAHKCLMAVLFVFWHLKVIGFDYGMYGCIRSRTQM